MIRRIDTRQLVQIMSFFLIVQFGGLLLSYLVFSTSTLGQISGTAVASSPSEALFYGLYIVVAAIVFLIIMKIYNGDMLFRMLEALVVISASFFVFLILINYSLGTSMNLNLQYIAAFVLATALVALKNLKPNLRNFVTILSSMGVGAVLGMSFSFFSAFILFAIIAVYDYVAVFITKHMITMAKALSSRNLAFLVGVSDVEAIPQSTFKKKEAIAYKKALAKAKVDKEPVFRNIMKSGKMPVISQIQLGAGDLGIPLMFAISAYPVFLNYFTSIVIIVGASFGLAATMWFLKKYERPLPAIPPIFSGVTVFMGIEFLFTGAVSSIEALLLVALGIGVMLFGMALTLKKGQKI